MSDDAPRRCLACEHAAHPYGPCPTWIKSGDAANRCGCAPRLGSVDEALAAIKSDCGWAHDVLSDEITALRAVREAAERVLAALDTSTVDGWPGAFFFAAKELRAALASPRPASRETEPAEQPPCPCCGGSGKARPRDTRPDVDFGSAR